MEGVEGVNNFRILSVIEIGNSDSFIIYNFPFQHRKKVIKINPSRIYGMDCY
jgi:hypothetical protein